MPRNKRSAEIEEEEEEDSKATEQPHESSESDDDEDEAVASGQDEIEGTDDEEEEASVDEKEIQVEFEAYPTEESDFHGVKKLLGQLFLKAKIDLSNLTEAIIAQPDTSFVIQQADGPEGEDDDDEVDQEVYGISSMVNLSCKDVKSIEELRKFLLSKCNNVANVEKLREILSNPEEHAVAWIVNERFINLSPQIALPCLQNLYSEVKKDATKYPYEYFIFIMKLLKSNAPLSKRKMKKLKKSHKNSDGDASACQVLETIYQNAEEEILADAADECVEWNVSEQCDSDARGGNWDEEDVKYTPWRKIVMLSRKSFQRSLCALKQELQSSLSDATSSSCSS